MNYETEITTNHEEKMIKSKFSILWEKHQGKFLTFLIFVGMGFGSGLYVANIIFDNWLEERIVLKKFRSNGSIYSIIYEGEQDRNIKSPEPEKEKK